MKKTLQKTLHKIIFLIPLIFIVGCENLSTSSVPASLPPSPYVTQVFDYQYGVGQHASNIPSSQEMKNNFLGTDPGFVYLGGWGGYIVAGFDHDVENLPGYDLGVFTQPSLGSEPAVVFVMDDTNRNGKPDDTWYELSGSETGKTYTPGDGYIKNYSLTYYKPSSLEANIPWEDNQGNSGFLVPGFPAGSFSSSWWWPSYGDSTTAITFTGVRLPQNKNLNNGIWLDIPGRFSWGYGENYEGNDLIYLPFGLSERQANRFDISDGLDYSGAPVELGKIRFIKIQSGVFLQAGVLNEVSPEISGAVDLGALNSPAFREKK